jgi:Tfp pilus assembly PilM family ATPase
MGVDIGDDAVKMVQLAGNGKSTSLIAGGVKNQPDDVKSGSGNWQRWAIEAICELTANGSFRGRSVIAAMPPGDVFIDHIRMPKIGDDHASDGRLRDAVFSKIKQKLPFEPNDAMIKYIPAEEKKVVVIAAERTIIDRHLAIYENANLQIRSIAVWPIALINSYTTFFGRRRADVEAVVMLLQIDTNRTNVVICRHKNLLFARSIPIGANQFDSDEEVATQSYDKSQSGNQVARLVLELTACKRQFGSMYKKAQIERLIFLSGQGGTKNICATVAKRLEMPAQIGDCLAAVKMADSSYSGIDRRNCQVNWATAFGLSLS